MSNNWTRISNIADYQPLVHKPTQFYTIICKGGKIRTAFPNIETDNNEKVKSVVWECGIGASGLEYDYNVIAFQPIEIPDDIIQQVLSNKRKTNYFASIYGC